MESSPSSEMAATDDPCRTRSSDSRGKKLANGQNIRPAGQEKERWHLINWSSSFFSNIYFSQKPKKYLPNSPTSLVSIRFLIGKPSKNKKIKKQIFKISEPRNWGKCFFRNFILPELVVIIRGGFSDFSKVKVFFLDYFLRFFSRIGCINKGRCFFRIFLKWRFLLIVFSEFFSGIGCRNIIIRGFFPELVVIILQ